MKKKKAVSPHRALQFIILSFFIVLGIISIIASGGGDGDGGVPVDNSPFYGDYTHSMTIDSCGIEIETITIGDDLTRENEDDYIYVPKNESYTTYTKGDRTITIERSGNTIDYTEDGKVWVIELTLAFSDDYNNFTVNGELIEDDPASCDGTVTGIGIRVGTVGVAFGMNYLQYRTSNTFNGYRGYIELTKDGIPLDQADIDKIELKDSSGALVDFNTVSFFPSTYYVGSWNSVTASVDFSGPVSIAGFGISFPGAFNLPADDYTWEVTTIDNKLASKQINYPGQKVLPFVDSATMTSQWLADGSLKLSWTNPPNNPPEDYDQLRVYITDDNAGEILYATLPANVNEMTIPSNWVDIWGDYYALTTVRWQVQTRSYTAENMNYARGLSDSLVIPPQP